VGKRNGQVPEFREEAGEALAREGRYDRLRADAAGRVAVLRMGFSRASPRLVLGPSLTGPSPGGYSLGSSFPIAALGSAYRRARGGSRGVP